MPCRPAIGREGGRKERRGRKEVEGGGLERGMSLHKHNDNIDTTKSNTAATEARWLELQLGDLGVPVGLSTQEAFCQLRVEGLQGQFGLTSPS